MTSHSYMTTTEAADYLNRSHSAIYKYIREGKLRTVYDEKWAAHKNKLIVKRDAYMLAQELEKPGLTPAEVAEKIGVHPGTVFNHIKNGSLKAETKTKKKNTIYYIKPEEVDRFDKWYTETNNKVRKSIFYHENRNIYLYQSLQHPETGLFGRIVSIDENKILIKTTDNNTMSLEEAFEQGLELKYDIPPKPFETRRGHVRFQFPKVDDIESEVYALIERLYLTVSYRNIEVKVSKNIEVDIKPCEISGNSSMKNEYQKYLVDGKVKDFPNSFVLNAKLTGVTFFIHDEIKLELADRAKKRRISQQKLLDEIITEWYNTYGQNQYDK